MTVGGFQLLKSAHSDWRPGDNYDRLCRESVGLGSDHGVNTFFPWLC